MATAVPVFRQTSGLDEALSVLTDALKGKSGKRRLRVRVWLSGGLCQPFLLPAINGVGNAPERALIAAAAAPEQTTLEAPCSVWMDPKAAPESQSLAVAVEASLPERVVRAVRPHAKLVSMRPWWAEALRAALPTRELAAFGLHDSDALTVLCGEGGAFRSAAAIAPVGDASAARLAWNRSLLAHDVPAEKALLLRWLPSCDASPFASCAIGQAIEVVS